MSRVMSGIALVVVRVTILAGYLAGRRDKSSNTSTHNYEIGVDGSC